MSRNLCSVLGFLFLAAGVGGIIDSHLLGLHLTPVLSVIHVLTALVTLYVGLAGSLSAVRGLSLVLGTAYALLGLLGIVAPGVVGRLLGHPEGLDSAALAPDNLLHVFAGGGFLLAGVMPAVTRARSITRLDLR
jgi:hypothetical protein